ncbi:MAG: CehA/McbA family metallohydrolase [Pirellulales bacterium]|nr:CehA/McbA family metallohydrolase [Pirellulales bacterium]
MHYQFARCVLLGIILARAVPVTAQEVARVNQVEGQPLAANISRVIDALEFLGASLPSSLVGQLEQAGQQRDAIQLQTLLDRHAVFVVTINPEMRVKVQRGPGESPVQQAGFSPMLVKVINQSTVARPLRISSPQAGPVYAGAATPILERQAQTELKVDENVDQRTDRFLSVEMFQGPPMTRNLSGLEVEYAIALIASQESGKREATIQFDVGQGTQDIGFRNEVPVLLDVRPVLPVKLAIHDTDGQPTAARLTIRDHAGRVYPPQAKRLAPDFFFQPQIYRLHGGSVLLPPGKFVVEFCRGPEYLDQQLELEVPSTGQTNLELNLKRWVNPMESEFYCGDHHIHGAGCSHYDTPTKGVRPEDMFVQVKGEGLNVGCVLTWGPCFEFQREFFQPLAHNLSERLTLLKYDLEISGFGSQALGHVCLLNLKDQTYPGSDGTKEKGWPTWTVPVLKWCKDQGGVTGYPHSAMHVNSSAAATLLIDRWDRNQDATLSSDECTAALLPLSFGDIDGDQDGHLTQAELVASLESAAEQLPNLAIPDMRGGGALEICVSTAEGVCDFISAMDTARIPEWNTWYHLMNCGFPLKLSGETDFPCMSSRRVGQGRVYVRLGNVDRLDFTAWCNGLGQGRSYVSDGYAHALEFSVDGVRPGESTLSLKQPATVKVKASVAFAPKTPLGIAYGTQTTPRGRRLLGDTVNLHAPRSTEMIEGGERVVEIVVNGRAVANRTVPADGNTHDLAFDVQVDQSSWIALRHFPELHTNPVTVLVGDRPLRASRDSARWCIEVVNQLWDARHEHIAEPERPAARAAYDRALERFAQIVLESPD